MAATTLLVIRPDLIINWWHITKVEADSEGGTLIVTLVDGNFIRLTPAEAEAFRVFARNYGERLDVEDTERPQPDGDQAGNRFSELARGG